MAFLSELEFDIKHIKGEENKIVGALIRHAYNLIEVAISNTNTEFVEQIWNSITNDLKYLEIQ